MSEARRKEEGEYRKAHHAAWNLGIDSVTDEGMDSGKLGGSFCTCCEAIVSVTDGWYAGQKDVGGFLQAVQRRMESDALAEDQRKAHRRDIVDHPIGDW